MLRGKHSIEKRGKIEFAKLYFGFYFGKEDEVKPRYLLEIPIPFVKRDHGLIYFHNFKGRDCNTKYGFRVF